jgi:hypothetical protein
VGLAYGGHNNAAFYAGNAVQLWPWPPLGVEELESDSDPSLSISVVSSGEN